MRQSPNFLKGYLENLSKLKIQSALNPMIYFSIGWAALGVWSASHFSATSVQFVILGAACIPGLVTCLQAIYFSIFNPSCLQSEEYQLKEKEMRIFKQARAGIIEVEDLKPPEVPASQKPPRIEGKNQ